MAIERTPAGIVQTTRCALCGARRGEDYELFAHHLATHGDTETAR